MSTLISDEYRDQLHKMRSANHRPNWGNGGQRHATAVHTLIEAYQPTSVLDYGCGHGMLIEELAKLSYTQMPRFYGYDPGIPERSLLPVPHDMVISTDCLEHVEPDLLDNVLEHIKTLTTTVAYINVHTMAANAHLPDGRNAHLIQQPSGWWASQLCKHFHSVARMPGFDDRRPSFVCV
jgi:methyltransferase family protein